MMKKLLLLSTVFLQFQSFSQTKKPLTHDVYDDWKSVGERAISNDGKFVAYTIVPQEGDGNLILQNVQTGYKLEIPRGYKAVITEDSKYAIFQIKPPYQDTRQAKIKKKKPDEMPRDSLGMVKLGTTTITKVASVKSFKTPEKESGWVAYLMEKSKPDSVRKKAAPDSLARRVDMLAKMADSLIRKSLDSVKGKIEKEEVITAAKKAVKEIYKKADEEEMFLADADGDDTPGAANNREGTDLIVKNLADNKTYKFTLVNDYLFDKKGNRLLIETSAAAKDSNSKAKVLVYNLRDNKTDTIMRALNDARQFVFDETGEQLAFVAERDSSSKALQKFYKLWYYTMGADSARMLADKNTAGMELGNTISEYADISFSKDGSNLYFGVSPIQPAKDTTLVDFELARLDVWHYEDDYLQPQQLKQLMREQRRSYTAVMQPGSGNLVQLGGEDAETITMVDEGNADWVLAESTKGFRSSMQWEGRTISSAYLVDTKTGKKTLVNNKTYSNYSPSPRGKYVYWYDPASENYFTYNVANGETRNITSGIRVPLYDTENDVPDFPRPAGTIGWVGNDDYILIKDEFDIWQVDPSGVKPAANITAGYGRKNKMEFSYVRLDREKRYLDEGEKILLSALNKSDKTAGYFYKKIDEVAAPEKITMGPFSTVMVMKAEDADAYLIQNATPAASELYYGNSPAAATALTNIAAQQDAYNWYTTELVHWKMFDGKMSEGILYKPENFDPKKKYPLIFYFYEKNADNLYNYKAPAPSASTINIPWFTSNGYLVFDPNIYYKTGEPGQSAYNSVVSAAKYLGRMPFVDSTRMAIQGQSWGGYQVAYLITRTNIFRAAGAGAPVANMTSAYGGIRWGTGLNRQFQYEKTQSRIGATLWERPDLYIKNSPLFTANKVETPVLIMHNDADGAVPWYQGIEYFTALKRLGKKVWLLQYNGEDHNLVERRNRKDLSVRLGQFFGYYLKDEPPARWIVEGLPALYKGRDWGLDTY